MGIIRETLNYYRERKSEEKAKKRLLNAKTDFHMLEILIQKCNDNPDLKVRIHTQDGVTLELTTYQHRKKNTFETINGVMDIE